MNSELTGAAPYDPVRCDGRWWRAGRSPLPRVNGEQWAGMGSMTCTPVPVSSKFNAAITPAISSDERDHESCSFFHVDIFTLTFFFFFFCRRWPNLAGGSVRVLFLTSDDLVVVLNGSALRPFHFSFFFFTFCFFFFCFFFFRASLSHALYAGFIFAFLTLHLSAFIHSLASCPLPSPRPRAALPSAFSSPASPRLSLLLSRPAAAPLIVHSLNCPSTPRSLIGRAQVAATAQ